MTHIFVGFLIYALLALSLPVETNFLSFMIFLIAVMVPDLDHPYSKVGRKVKPVSWLINIFFGHRGLTHSLLGALIFSAAAGYVFQLASLPNSLIFWFFAGFTAHLIGDSLTPSGVKWLYPFSKIKIKSFIKTGSFLETLFLAGVISSLVFMGWKFI